MVRAVTRRRMLRASAAASLGLGGAAVLAACGEIQVVTKEVPVDRVVVKEVPVETVVTKTEIKEVPVERVVMQTQVQVKEVEVEKVVEKVVEVEKVVTQIVEVEKGVEKVVEVEAMPVKEPVQIEFLNDHTSGPRGEAMKWALDRFAQEFPHIKVRFIPQPAEFTEWFNIRLAAGTQGEIALLAGWFNWSWVQYGAFAQINDTLAKHDGFDPAAYFATPDINTLNVHNKPYSGLDSMQGPAFGLPYQGNMTSYRYNLEIAESAGIDLPATSVHAGGSWGLETDFLEAMKQARDPETDKYGIAAAGGSWPATGWWAIGMSNRDDSMVWYNADATHFELFDDGGDRGFRLAIDMIHEYDVAYPPEARERVSGEFGDPFSAGNVFCNVAGGGHGSIVNRVQDRFPWTIGANPEGVRGTIPANFDGQPHVVTNAASARGTLDETIELLVFMSGEQVQTRIAIEGGSTPANKAAMFSSEHALSVPRGGHILGEIAELPDHRHGQMAHPDWLEILVSTFFASAVSGEQTVDEHIEEHIRIKDAKLTRTHDNWEALKAFAESLPS